VPSSATPALLNQQRDASMPAAHLLGKRAHPCFIGNIQNCRRHQCVFLLEQPRGFREPSLIHIGQRQRRARRRELLRQCPSDAGARSGSPRRLHHSKMTLGNLMARPAFLSPRAGRGHLLHSFAPYISRRAFRFERAKLLRIAKPTGPCTLPAMVKDPRFVRG